MATAAGSTGRAIVRDGWVALALGVHGSGPAHGDRARGLGDSSPLEAGLWSRSGGTPRCRHVWAAVEVA